MNPARETRVDHPTLSESSSSDEGWQDVEPDEEEVVIISLFDDKVFSSVHAMLDYCRDNFQFDFIATKNRLKLDFHGTVKLCNYSMFFFLCKNDLT
jgi:protein arginine N-methyltransferase 3